MKRANCAALKGSSLTEVYNKYCILPAVKTGITPKDNDFTKIYFLFIVMFKLGEKKDANSGKKTSKFIPTAALPTQSTSASGSGSAMLQSGNLATAPVSILPDISGTPQQSATVGLNSATASTPQQAAAVAAGLKPATVSATNQAAAVGLPSTTVTPQVAAAGLNPASAGTPATQSSQVSVTTSSTSPLTPNINGVTTSAVGPSGSANTATTSPSLSPSGSAATATSSGAIGGNGPIPAVIHHGVPCAKLLTARTFGDIEMLVKSECDKIVPSIELKSKCPLLQQKEALAKLDKLPNNLPAVTGPTTRTNSVPTTAPVLPPNQDDFDAELLRRKSQAATGTTTPNKPTLTPKTVTQKVSKKNKKVTKTTEKTKTKKTKKTKKVISTLSINGVDQATKTTKKTKKSKKFVSNSNSTETKNSKSKKSTKSAASVTAKPDQASSQLAKGTAETKNATNVPEKSGLKDSLNKTFEKSRNVELQFKVSQFKVNSL